jgi:hypothetical protein
LRFLTVRDYRRNISFAIASRPASPSLAAKRLRKVCQELAACSIVDSVSKITLWLKSAYRFDKLKSVRQRRAEVRENQQMRIQNEPTRTPVVDFPRSSRSCYISLTPQLPKPNSLLDPNCSVSPFLTSIVRRPLYFSTRLPNSLTD